MRRASISVPSNIVEGCARETQADYIRFLYIAFGSLKELHYQLDLSNRLGFINDLDFTMIESKIIETEKVLNGLIRSLRVDWFTLAFSLQPKILSIFCDRYIFPIEKRTEAYDDIFGYI